MTLPHWKILSNPSERKTFELQSLMLNLEKEPSPELALEGRRPVIDIFFKVMTHIYKTGTLKEVIL